MPPRLAIAAAPLAHFLTVDDEPAPRSPHPALQYFEASTFEEAAPAARALYASVDHCPRCHSLLAHRFERLGSTLFHDEDPRALARAFDAADRDGCTVRLLAACIVLFGRDRVSLH
jgi:hypothetical protein